MMKNNFTFSVDLAALARDQLRTAADVASGRITPAQARARAAEARKVLNVAETIFKLGQMTAPNCISDK